MKIAGTGHRPNKLAFRGCNGYSVEAAAALEELAFDALGRYPAVTAVISGMALGWDQALARAAVRRGLPFLAYVPFEGQEKMWPEPSQDTFHELLAQAATVVICSEGEYHPRKMQLRNEAMVRDCDRVLALFDGTKGGTWNCVEFARKIRRPVDNCWPEWQRRQKRTPDLSGPWICQVCAVVQNGRTPSAWRPDLTGKPNAGNICPSCLALHQRHQGHHDLASAFAGL